MPTSPTPPRTDATLAHQRRLLGRTNFERISPGKYAVADFELSRMAALLADLGEPQLATPCVHVAGSKGKGSVATAVSAALAAGGARCGLFTSPHVHHFEERVRIGGEFLPAAAWEAAFGAVWPAVDRMDAEGRRATFFEIVTAVAWLAFRGQSCDAAAVEVGLGGRLDSTNLCRPLVTVVTSISRDHGQLLGDSLSQIAAEKAGILKPGVPCVSGAEGEAAAVIEARAAEVGCPLWRLGREIELTGSAADPMRPREVSVRTPAGSRAVPVALPGRHQERNAALAAAALDLLPESLRPTPEEASAGLASLACPLRVEVVGERPRVVLDAAHNGASVAALVAAVSEVPAARRWLVFGTSSDKHVEDMLAELRGAADRVVVTAYSTNPRALPADELATQARAALGQDVEVAADPAAAVALLRREAGPEDLVVCTGSFYLAGEVRELLAERPLG